MDIDNGATAKRCSVSIDLDPLTAYYAIHGLGAPPPKLRYTILRYALPRFETLFDELDIRATFFVVGNDLEQSAEARKLLKRLATAGHEIGNHSYSHPYELCRANQLTIDNEVRTAHNIIGRTLGKAHVPCGFRSPGYFINGKVYKALAEAGYLYDSSMFPSPAYYLAKAAVLLGMGLRGRTSGAIVNDPRSMITPADPYLPDPEAPWRRGNGDLVELPVAVSHGLRLPAIGTSLAVAPSWLRRHLVSTTATRPFFNLELHGIDLVDAVTDRIPTELAGRQPDLRVPVADKTKMLRDLIAGLQQTHEVVSLRDAAAAYREELS